MDEQTFHKLCEVRALMAKREWVCARNYFDEIMTEIHEQLHEGVNK
nr:MAG: hypothetical protein [Microviridae sp.]